MRNVFKAFIFVFGLIATISAVLHWFSGESATDVYGESLVWAALVLFYLGLTIKGLICLLNQEAW
jgi:ABC-type phosphate transport system permease subunit